METLLREALFPYRAVIPKLINSGPRIAPSVDNFTMSFNITQEVSNMKKITRTFVALTLALALTGFVASFAAVTPQQGSGQSYGQQQNEQSLSGTLMSVDPDAQTFVVQDASGNQTTFHYNDQTEVAGSDQTIEGLASESGTQVTVHFQEQESGRMATKIEIQKAQQ